MNSDRCYHVPTSPGQTICTCRDELMWWQFRVQVLSELVGKLMAERGAHGRKPEVIELNVWCP